MKRFVSVLLLISIALSLAACGAPETEVTETTEAPSTEVVLTPEQQYALDAQDGDIFWIFGRAAREVPETYNSPKGFTDMVASMERMAEKNLFAAEFAEKAKSVTYEEWSIAQQLAFDAYIGFLFREEYYEITANTLGKFTEAWYGDCEEVNCSYLYFRLEDCNEILSREYTEVDPSYWDDMDFDYIRVLFDREDGALSVKRSFEDSSLLYNEKLRERKVELSFNEYAYFDLVDVTSDLNTMLEENQEFINYLLTYREEVYAPMKNRQLAAKLEEEEAEEAREKEMAEKEPQIGMTAEEVRKGKWGEPDKINKDTYAWGTTEQWVYDNRGYIHFENGIVTSIHER